MAKKLIDNGQFESSFLILDDQELEQIHRTLIDSYNRRLRIRITVFDQIEDKVYEGVVSTINTYLMEIKLVWVMASTSS
ncbi:YolD-like family protein [Paenibacillus illinoisensis]|uniref:YolD-like family protein n=1 Tax=Paenibacillus illinoisensis TaxID=59845 RepID=UPI003019A21F